MEKEGEREKGRLGEGKMGKEGKGEIVEEGGSRGRRELRFLIFGIILFFIVLKLRYLFRLCFCDIYVIILKSFFMF